MFSRSVHLAFDDLKYPGDGQIVYDNSGYHDECSDIAAAFRGKHWNNLPLEFLREYYAAVFFFTPLAFQFYLPAYLIVSVTSYEAADQIPDTIIFTLSAHLNQDREKYRRFRSKMGLFSEGQRKVIQEFLRIMNDEHGEDFPDDAPMKALKSYWCTGFGSQ